MAPAVIGTGMISSLYHWDIRASKRFSGFVTSCQKLTRRVQMVGTAAKEVSANYVHYSMVWSAIGVDPRPSAAIFGHG